MVHTESTFYNPVLDFQFEVIFQQRKICDTFDYILNIHNVKPVISL
ncbi:hypothetical protein SEENIN0B_03487 [Salmonella enterica subsp. enterica serovar Infantis str. SARB27]|uniref:Uncharacterized protein n=1 Tax=Salmonella enterica subsp. enterica serovar Infantis str. SARB27 TaxID=596155 RepID=A0A6C8GC12_SALIN|nr:hypothetical protein SEENIN0B_03487 [Salmonella enterica subsp. enterica serovar Infantis str. SARB27]